MDIRKIFAVIVAMTAFAFSGMAQKFALVDMEYVLGNMQSYEVANNTIEQMSQRWKK